MKKQVAKITLKTDQIISLSKAQAQLIAGGMPPASAKTCSSHYVNCPF